MANKVEVLSGLYSELLHLSAPKRKMKERTVIEAVLAGSF